MGINEDDESYGYSDLNRNLLAPQVEVLKYGIRSSFNGLKCRFQKDPIFYASLFIFMST